MKSAVEHQDSSSNASKVWKICTDQQVVFNYNKFAESGGKQRSCARTVLEVISDER